MPVQNVLLLNTIPAKIINRITHLFLPFIHLINLLVSWHLAYFSHATPDVNSSLFLNLTGTRLQLSPLVSILIWIPTEANRMLRESSFRITDFICDSHKFQSYIRSLVTLFLSCDCIWKHWFNYSDLYSSGLFQCQLNNVHRILSNYNKAQESVACVYSSWDVTQC